MALTVTRAKLPEVLLIKPEVFCDERGSFKEIFQATKYAEIGIPVLFAQDNVSRSCYGTLRGLHYQLPYAQGKLLSVVRGEVFDVAVDIRKGSPRFGQWVGEILSDTNHIQLYIPPGFAHGFCVLSEVADVVYKCTQLYRPGADRGIHWSDPAIGIDWLLENPLLSQKDAALPRLNSLSEEDFPQYEG